MTAEDERIIERIKSKNIPYLIVKNKADLFEKTEDAENTISVSAATGQLSQNISTAKIIHKNLLNIFSSFSHLH